MKKISIPEPCSENWSLMAPTEKGAFCNKCSLEVYDFTKKTPEEIRETLTINLGKRVCGHVNKVQLELVNSDFHVWENQPVHVFQSKFLCACLLVFGMTLFTGCENLPPQDVQGDMEQVDGGMTMEEDTSTCSGNEVLTGDTVYNDQPMVGEMEAEETHDNNIKTGIVAIEE